MESSTQMTRDTSEMVDFAVKIYRQCRDSPGQHYKTMAPEARQLANTLLDLNDISPRLSPTDQEALAILVQECSSVLLDLSTALKEYRNLSLQSRRTWERMDWGHNPSLSLQARLTTILTHVASFYASVTGSPRWRVDEALALLLEDYRAGHRETNSVFSCVNYEGEEDAAWPAIVAELRDLGVSDGDVEEDREYITEWFVRATNEGLLQEDEAEVQKDGDCNGAEEVVKPSLLQSICSTTATPEDVSTSTSDEYKTHTGTGNRFLMPPSSRCPTLASNSWLTTSSSNTSLSSYSTQPPPSQQQQHQQDCHQAPIKDSLQSHNPYQEFVHHWNARAWSLAEPPLKHLLQAASTGESLSPSSATGVATPKPLSTSRLFTHLLGVLASFQGHFFRAKKLFAAVHDAKQLQSYGFGYKMDDGDIAAARWLGDTCLLLNEPLNAGLAWAAALDASLARYGRGEQAMRVLDDLRVLEAKLRGLTALKSECSHYTNGNGGGRGSRLDLFRTMAVNVKARLVTSALRHIKHVSIPYSRERRPEQNLVLTEDQLVYAASLPAYWPLKWDPFFRTVDTLALNTGLDTRSSSVWRTKRGFREGEGIEISTIKAVALKNEKKLDYATEMGPSWLLEALRRGLERHGLEFRERGSDFLVRVGQARNRIAYYEGVAIKVRRLPMRRIYGIRIDESSHLTRCFEPAFRVLNDDDGSDGESDAHRKGKVCDEIRNLAKDFLADAEKDAEAAAVR
ncbi:hypothetical protein K490DRAFT_69874 [Saccharata proteae CBS 121410]|uniref:Uncharacterized protein n=1 Tax=Saccharata proteae CBS 121410 TaxID=1314787 RepID=A0A9P4LUR9_9PEZI|nr:hypothetical protein K490DRAFT_69874 [Saccharata proteae CBS 121410]